MKVVKVFISWSTIFLLIAASSWAAAGQWLAVSGNVSISGSSLTLTAANNVSRAEIRDIAVVPGQTYTVTGNVYSSARGWTYIGIVNGNQEVEQGGNWSASRAITPISFRAQTSKIKVYGSFWTGQTGKGFVNNVKLNGVALVGGSSSSSSVASGPCSGNYILCDDFNAASIDTSKWTVGNVNIGNKYPVRPENISLGTHNDNGTTVTVVNAKIYGDLHTAAPRQGGVLITKNQFGGGRYEARMKNLPGPHGCSCLWNYYDSENEVNPPATRVYTEIDIEMPAHANPVPAWATWQRILGFNTWSHSDADADATYINHPSNTVNPFDGNFHVYRWDWYDGGNGNLRIDWYVDNILQATTTQHVGSHPAQLWVGAWPAPWPGMNYNVDTVHMYIDWVRISAL